MASKSAIENIVAKLHESSSVEGFSSYLQWVSENTADRLVHPETEHVEWQLLELSDDRNGLLRPICINGKSKYQFQLASVLDRVTVASIVVAVAEGDLLFVSSEGYVVYFDGKCDTLLRVADTWDEFLTFATFLPKPAATENDAALVGRWKPIPEESESDLDFFFLVNPQLTFTSDGFVVEQYGDGSIVKAPLNVNSEVLTIHYVEGEVQYLFSLSESELTLELTDGSLTRRFER